MIKNNIFRIYQKYVKKNILIILLNLHNIILLIFIIYIKVIDNIIIITYY